MSTIYVRPHPTVSNPDRVAVIGVSPGTDFGLSSETDPTGVEEEFRRSQDVIVKSILEVERIMGFPATEGNFYVYFPQGLSVGGLHSGGSGGSIEGILLNRRFIATTHVTAHEVAHYYFRQLEGPHWFYEGAADYIGTLAQRNVDSPPFDLVGPDVTNRRRDGALGNCERGRIAPATITNAESVGTKASFFCSRYLGEYVIHRVADHVGEERILQSLREVHAEARKREKEGPRVKRIRGYATVVPGGALTTKEIFDILLDPQDPAFAGIRNELIAVIGATATHTPSVPVTPETDKQALIALFNATGGQQWERKANWLTDAPVSLWEGVATDGEGRVIELHLSLNQLSGEIPGELGNLVNLKLLDLSANQLSGEIPGELSNLVNLTYLDLHYDKQLNGEIPGELGNLVNLTYLDLSNNQLSGEIPVELSNLVNLTSLDLSGNQLSGEIPVELSNLVNLTSLRLAHNHQLSGEIPGELGNLVNLTRLDLANNQLSGEIPGELGNLVNLTSLELSRNQLSGEIPGELGNLVNLEYLYLYNTQLSGCLPRNLIDQLKYFETGGVPFC